VDGRSYTKKFQEKGGFAAKASGAGAGSGWGGDKVGVVFLSTELRSIPRFMGPRRKLASMQTGHYVLSSSGQLSRP